MTYEFSDEEMNVLRDFRNLSDTDQQAMFFDALMNLLTDAVAGDDIDRIKNYARLVTEAWNSYEDDDE